MDITCGTLSSLVDKIRDLVIDLTWEQLRYLFQYHRNIEELNERLEELTGERSSKQQQIDNARNNLEQIEKKVQDWLGEVDKIIEQTQMFHEQESQAKTECSVTSCPNLWLRYKLSKRAKAMAQQAVKIYEKRNFDRISYPVPPLAMSEFLNRESNEGIGSRMQVVNQIMEELHNPSVNIVGLCGLGGVGKTTIAKDVAEKVKNQNMFEKVIMATVSNELNVEKIQGQIAEKLGMQLNEKFEEVRACRLCERLKQEKNMLLILDDLWEELDLGRVGIPFVDVGSYSKKNEGCKILLTSRNKSLLSNLMKCQKIIEVGVLSGDEAWELFKRIAELSVDSSNLELTSTASEIVQKCGRLPLAIATAAKGLRGKSLDEWQDYLARLKSHLRRSSTGIREVDASLKLSYDPLSPENKTIFLLSAMLSHDPSIEDLLMYSVGLDVLEGIENMEEAHVGISTIVRKLKSLNLFLDSISGHHVTIHDVFRDVALSITPNELNVFIVRHRSLKEWPDKNKLEGYKGICLQKSDISDLPKELHGPRLEFFLLDSTKHDLTIPSMFFNSSKELKLLAFTNVNFSSLPSLSVLLKLKTLCLHSCLLGDITEIRNLKNLEVLSLAYSVIQRLPVELAELTSLQMLNLACCSMLKVIPPKLLSSFKKLEVLYMENSFNQWKVEGSSEANENISLEELKDLPISSLNIHIPNVSMLPENLFLDMNLKRYRILIGKHWKWWDVNYESSKILKLELENNIHLKPGVRKLMKGAEDLCLYGSNGLENVLHGHDGRGFSHLRHLQIVSNDTIILNSAHHEAATNNKSNKMSESLFNKVLLPKLEILELSFSISLIPLIWDDQLSHTSFSNLKTLKVKKCGFVKLVPLRVLKSLNNLEELEVVNCDMLETVFDFEDLSEYEELSSSIPSVVVPLKKLTLHSLPKLKNVWSNHRQGSVFSFPSLRNVYAYGCDSLRSMFPASIAKGMLRDLEELRINDCGIDVIVAKDQVSESVASAFVFPRLTSLQLYLLQNLRNFYPQRHTLQWPQLQRLSIEYCDELEIFEKEVSTLLQIHEEESTLDLKYPLLSHDQDIRNLELRLAGKQAKIIGSGQFPMRYRFPQVKLLHLSPTKATTISCKSLLKSFPKLEELELGGHIKKAFGGDNVPFRIKLTLQGIFNMTSLAPSLVSLPNLTHLHVRSCYRLTMLMTSSTARSMVHLTHLSIRDCPQIKEIMLKQEGEDDEHKAIVFNKLQYLQLHNLSRLKRFCGHNYTFRFPLLDTLIIEGCQKLEIFSPGLTDTPSLKSIQLSRDGGKKHHEIWGTNLNKVIHQQRFVASRVMMLDEDDVSMIRNKQFPTDHFPEVEILSIKGFDDEGATLLERFPQLKELRVENSSFEEIFPSQAHIVHEIPPFEELCLANLTVLQVFLCHRLVYLMTSSIAKSLVNLETLAVRCCDKMEEIVMKQEGEDDEDKEILFSKLKLLKLHGLQRLKRFCGRNYTCRFPLLECITIGECHQLTMFCPGVIHVPQLQSIRVLTDQPKLYHKDIWMTTDVNNTIQHEFMTQEVISTTRNMVLNAENITMMMAVFPEVANLYVESFKDEGVTFPYSSLERFPKLYRLYVEHSSFEEIFPSNDQILDFMGKIPPFELLHISHLDQLKRIWKDDPQRPPIHQNLTDLMVKSCCNLVKLAPSSASFQNLTRLTVSGCHQLIHLVTTSTAKSLVSLWRLEIKDCKKMEEIVMNETNEDVEGGIIFHRLLHIELADMPSLKMFSSQSHNFQFPELIEIKITGCPEMKTFCPRGLETPELSEVNIEGHDMEWEDEGDLNKTIEMLCSAKDRDNI